MSNKILAVAIKGISACPTSKCRFSFINFVDCSFENKIISNDNPISDELLYV